MAIALPEESQNNPIAHDSNPDSTLSPGSSSEESTEKLEDPDTTGDLLPSNSQSQIKEGEEEEDAPDSAVTTSFTYLIYLVNSILAVAVGFYVL
uniref:Uncharacterized protein n=1 Tax=Ditylenchus dipsaci TaxID=166011 RepID=A0A915EFF3_9BILA